MPNYGKRGVGPKLMNGLVIAIEPMINMGTKNIHQHNDGWTITTADNKPSAHFEHTIVVRQGKADILSSFEWIEKELNKNKYGQTGTHRTRWSNYSSTFKRNV